ncbi:MAG: DedA family protein [Planctomycetota bacterium]|nr:MAG: DedA family protein [Planctomycetota bacterium]
MPYESWPYFCVFTVLIFAGLGVPIPEDIPLLTGGYLCHIGLAHLLVMIAIGMIGVLGGDFILYSLGRKWGHHIVEHRFVRRLVRPTRLLIAEKLFNQHGVKIIFAGRFLPGLRPMIFVASGVLKVPFWTFASVNGMAACISVPIMVVLGLVFGQNFDRLKSDVRTATHLIAFGILIAGLIAAGIYLHRRQKRMMASTGIDRRIDAKTLAHMSPILNIPIPEPEDEEKLEEEPQPQAVETAAVGETTINV